MPRAQHASFSGLTPASSDKLLRPVLIEPSARAALRMPLQSWPVTATA